MTKEQVREIAELKMPDLNAASVEAAMNMWQVRHGVWNNCGAIDIKVEAMANITTRRM